MEGRWEDETCEGNVSGKKVGGGKRENVRDSMGGREGLGGKGR